MAEKTAAASERNKRAKRRIAGGGKFLYKALFAIGNYVGEKSLHRVGAGDE